MINVSDYSLVPDGSNYGSSNNYLSTQDQRTNVTVAAGGTIVNGTRPIVYFVTTFRFGTGTSADINLNFTASAGQDRLGVKVRANGTVSSTGDGSDGSSDFNFGGGLAGQDVTKVGAGLRAIQVGRPGLVAPVSGRWTEAVGSCAPPCPGFVSPEPPGPANHIIVRLDGA